MKLGDSENTTMGKTGYATVVYPAPSDQKATRFGYSVECLTFATLLEQSGFSVRYFDFSIQSFEVSELMQLLSAREQVFIYFDSVPLHRSSNVPNALALCESLKSFRSSLTIVAFGPWCMINRRSIPFADEVWTDEAELCLKESLIGTYRPFVSSSPRLLNSIETLPSPNRTLLPEVSELAKRSSLAPSAVMQTSRGCPMGCRFCPRQAWNNRKIRHRKISACVSELADLVSSGIKNIWIDDDNMGADEKWACDFFDSVSERLGNVRSQFGLYLSTDVNASWSFFEKARKAGVRIVSFGIESGSQKVLDYYRKPSSPEIIKTGVAAADRAGLFVVGNFIVGAPNEWEEDHQMTRRLLEQLPFDEINVKILSIVQGAPLWREMVSSGIMHDDMYSEFARSENGTSTVSLAESKRRQQELYKVFRDNTLRRERLTRKATLIGPPYFLDTQKHSPSGGENR